MVTHRYRSLVLTACSCLLLGCATVGPEAPVDPVEEAVPAEPIVEEVPPAGEVAEGELVPEDGAGVVAEIEAVPEVSAEPAVIDESYKGAIAEFDWEGAESQLDAVLLQSPAASQAHHDLALVKIRLGKPGEAIDAAQQAFALNPQDVVAARMAISLLAAAGRLSDAELFAENAANKAPKDVNIRNLEVDVLIERKEYLRAIDQSRDLLKQDEVNVSVMKNLARAYYYMGKEKTAKFVFLRALELDKSDAEILYYLARIGHRANRNREKILALYARVLEVRPDMPEVLNNVGLIFYETRNWELAEERFAAAVKASPKFKEARLNWANSLRGLQRYDEADQVFEALLNEFPGYAPAYYNRGLMYWENEFGSLGKQERFLRAAELLRQYKEARGSDLGANDPVDAYIKEATEMAGQVKAAAEEEIRLAAEAEERMKKIGPKGLAVAQIWDDLRAKLIGARDAWQQAGNVDKVALFEGLITEYDDMISYQVSDLRSAVENKLPDDIQYGMDELETGTVDFMGMVDEAFVEPPPDLVPTPDESAPEAELPIDEVPGEVAPEPGEALPVEPSTTEPAPMEDAPVEYSTEPVEPEVSDTPVEEPMPLPDDSENPPIEAEPTVGPDE
jgi:tetratricopeptide (TPR) repeat protein